MDFPLNKANLRDLIAATGLMTLFGLCDLEIGPMSLKNNRDLLPCPFQLCVSFHSHQCIQHGLTVRKRSIRSKLAFFVSHDHKIGQMTLRNNRALLLCLFYFHASFLCHQWIQLWVIVQKHSDWVNIGDFFTPVTLKFHRWPLKTSLIHLSFQALCIISQPSVNFNLSYSRKRSHRVKLDDFLSPCDLEISRMTLKNNRALLLNPFKLHASFHSHW